VSFVGNTLDRDGEEWVVDRGMELQMNNRNDQTYVLYGGLYFVSFFLLYIIISSYALLAPICVIVVFAGGIFLN